MSNGIPSNQLASYVTFSPYFSDNMIFQRGKPIVLFGTAEPEKKIIIRVNEIESLISSDSKGNWSTEMDVLPVGMNYECKIFYKKELTLKNIACGDLYLCSGQSNMEMQLDGWGRVNNFREEIAFANFNNIRMLKVDHNTCLNEQRDIITSGWKICSSDTVPGFSAAAYFFAKQLVKDVDIPIGLIQSTWPGSPIEAWMSKESLFQFRENENVLTKLNSDAKLEEMLTDNFITDITNWEKEIFSQEPAELSCNWKEKFEWQPVILPYLWQEKDFPEFNGSVWFRKSIELHENLLIEDCTLSLGPIKDSYSIWVNGNLIKSVSPLEFIREHRIPKGILAKGENEIVVRVFAEQFGGGFWGDEEEIRIYNTNFSQSIVTGWFAAKGVDLKTISEKPKNPTDVDVPTVLFNAMINPLTRLWIKGILWYQGESNVDEAEIYSNYFRALITDWRERFKDANIPFLFVQLANYNDLNDDSNEQWAKLRHAQETVLQMEYTGMVCSIDIGEANNIHPRNKQDIGTRLALLAKKMIYNKNVIVAGPKYINHRIKTDSIIVEWSISGNSLLTNDSLQAREFMIASENKNFYKANSEIEKNKIILTSNEVKRPVAVRYAWSNNPDCNLTDESGLPALPFRTDSW
ncbi:MAG: sialate O-acetylesterase [Ignavibacteriaceae bacterium]